MKTPPLNASLPNVDDGGTARLLPDEEFGASYVGAGARNNTAPISARFHTESVWTAVLTAEAFRCSLDTDDAATSYGVAQEA